MRNEIYKTKRKKTKTYETGQTVIRRDMRGEKTR